MFQKKYIMRDLIEKMWYEDYRLSEKHYAYGEKISIKQYILVNYENKLSSMLDDDGKKVLDDYIKLLFDVLDLERIDAFIGGTKFTYKMIKGIFSE